MLRTISVGIVCLVASAALAQSRSEAPAQPAAIGMEQPQPGDFWTYELRDEITGTVTETRRNVVTEVTPSEISVRHNVVGKDGDGLNVYDRFWNLKSNPPWKYQPNDGFGIRTPLKVDAAWNFQGDNINASNGNIWKRTGHSKVVEQQTITTKAGTFDAFRIETVASMRPTSDPTLKNELTQQTWFAPAIDHWVKRTLIVRVNGHVIRNNTIELVEYGRKK